MLLVEEKPDFDYVMRGADGHSARVNDEVLARSFIITPDRLIRDWPVRALAELDPAALDALLALAPEVVLLGTGATQDFPHPAVMAACLQRGIGIEVMANDAAARTYSVLAGEGRRVAAGFVFPR